MTIFLRKVNSHINLKGLLFKLLWVSTCTCMSVQYSPESLYHILQSTLGSVNSRSQTTIGTKHYIYCVFFRHRLKCLVCWLLCVQTIGFFSLIFLPTKIVGFEAFKWSDRLKVCDSGDKVIVLVSILWKKLWWRSCRER